MIDTRKIRMAIIMLVSLIAGVGVFALMSSSDGFGEWEALTLLIVVSIGVLATIAVLRMRRDAKEGQPVDDERTMQIKTRAGYISFFASMYLVLAMGWLSSIFEDNEEFAKIETGELFFIVVAIMGCIYFSAWVWLQRRARTQ